MAKEKKRLIDEKEQQETIFYYEIIGSIAIILSITTLGKLGKIGSVLTILFKVSFGDWYWFIVLLILFIGFYNLFLHRKFDFRNQRFIGLIFISFTILMFSHFPIHKYISNTEGNYLSKTWSLYRSYINTKEASSLGGGLIGGLGFYAIYYLLGSVGVIILGFILFVLGLSLIFNMPLSDLGVFLWNRFKRIKKYSKSFNKFFKYEVGKEIHEKTKETKIVKKARIPLKLFNNYIDEPFDTKYSEEITLIINKALSSYHLLFRQDKCIISYYVTTYYYTLFLENNLIINERDLFKSIKSNLFQETFFSLLDNGFQEKTLIIQIANKYKSILSMKELFIKSDGLYKDNEIIPLGISYLNEVIIINHLKKNNLLLIGDIDSGIKSFIKSIIITYLYLNSVNNYDIFIYDNYNDFQELSIMYTKIEGDTYILFDKLKEIIDERQNILSEVNVNNYNEYLHLEKDNKHQLNKGIIIINEFDTMSDPKVIENKLLYFTSISKKVGISIIYVVRNEKLINNVISSIFDIKILFKAHHNLVNKVIDINHLGNNSEYLEGKGDAFFIDKNTITRFLPPFVTKEELSGINNFLQNK